MGVTFEVERFEWAADDRLELEGRWFGLRGRRFIRPTLDVEVDGQPRRLLALMEHKPWAALDGEEWLAAFKWEGDRGDVAAELAVGPDLSFELPRPNGGPPGKASPKRLAAAAANVVQPARRTSDDGVRRKLAEAERARNEAASEAMALRRALGQKERTVRELREELDALRAEAATEKVDAPEPPDPVRDEVAQNEPNAEIAELRRQLDAAIAARHAAIEQADAAERKRYEAAGALAAAEREAQAAVQAADDARAERDELRAAARAARNERDAAISERDAALARLASTRRERDSAQLARDAERADRPQVAGVAEAVRRRGPLALVRPRAERTHDEVLALRFAALVALSVVCLLVGIWFLAV